MLRVFIDYITILSLVGIVTCLSTNFLFSFRFFWFCILSGCCYCAASVLLASMELYSDKAISYTVETDYLEWETPFPAVTVCEAENTNRIRELFATNNLDDNLMKFARDVTYWSAQYCKACKHPGCTEKTCLDNFTYLIDIIRLNCSDIFKECWWDGTAFPCCERFLPLQTEYGTCFTFNSRLTGDNTIYTVNRRIGLPNLVFTTTAPFFIRIHSPNEYVAAVALDSAVKCFVLPLGSNYEIALMVEQTISDVNVKKIQPDSRDCLYSHEGLFYVDDWPFATYSNSACELHCKAMRQLQYCNCTHHFIPRTKGTPVCGAKGLTCLSDNKDKIAKASCACPMDCEELTYTPIFTYCPRIPQLQKRIRAQIRLGHLPTLRVRRHAMRELLGFVVDFGGVIGVFFGASLLSFIEIVYLLCLRKQN